MAEPEPLTPEEPVSEDELAGEDEEEKKPEEKMTLGFYLTLALVGLLVILILAVNIPGIKASAGTTMTQANWTLQSYSDSTGILVPVISGSAVTARFETDGRFAGSAGCNHYSAIYAVKNYEIAVSNVLSTEMSCPEPGIMAQETAYLNELPKSVSLGVSDTVLKFYDSSGKTLIVYQRS